MKNLKDTLLRPSCVFIIYLIGINAISLQSVLANRMDIFDIYRWCYPHLVDNRNLYLFYPSQYSDLFKYSPTFCVFFYPFSILPYYVSYFLWNNLMMLIMPIAIYSLPLGTKKKSLICYFVFIECLTCLQGTQANTILAACIVLAFSCFEKRQTFLAALFIAIATYVKIFPIAACVLFLFYPEKLKFIGSFLLSMAILFFLPLIFINFHELIGQYKNWTWVLGQDHSHRYGISVLGVIGNIWNISNATKLIIQITGFVLFLLMLLRVNCYKSIRYRIYFLISLLCVIVLFNHDAEDFSYTMTMTAIGIWFFLKNNTKSLNITIIAFLIVVSVFPIDPTPKPLIHFMVKYALKALPCAVVWLILLTEMITGHFAKSDRLEEIPI